MSLALIFMLIIFLIFLAVGVPVAFSIGASAIICLLMDGSMPAMVVPQRMFVMLDSFSLMAIPLFILAGELMAQAGITKRIVRFASAMLGHLHASLAHVTILASMLLAGISGSASADTAALGSLMIPAMEDEGYDPDVAACVVATGGIIGPIIPPSIMMILYGSITGASISDLFLGGVVPGILMGLGTMVLVAFTMKRRKFAVKPRASAKERISATIHAIPALVMPVIILAGILSGKFTATEAGGIACLYALIYGVLTRNINFKNIYQIFANAVMGTTVPMFIIGIAAIFGWVMTRFNLPSFISSFILGMTGDPNVFIIIVMVLYFFLGLFMEANAGMLIMTPIMFPIAKALGFSAAHFGVLTVVNFCIGSITPPVGLQLFIASSIAKQPLSKVSKTIWPFIGVMSLILVLCALIPDLVMFVPRLFGN